MDSNRLPHSSDGLHLGPGSSHRRRPDDAPVSPRAPATPGAVGQEADGYFPPLREEPSVDISAEPSVAPSDVPSTAPSTRSRFSRFSFSLPSSSRAASAAPPPTDRPALSQGSRQPSIRLRRRSNGSLGSDAGHVHYPAPSGGYLVPHLESDHGRPRSISQPERARVSEGPGMARHSRRAPSEAMPRLTEEGPRPTAADMGLSPPLSPSLSLPGHTASPGQAIPVASDEPAPRKRFQGARNMSRMFWPGHGHRAEKQPAPPLTAAEAEYQSQLVDWLDLMDPEVQTLSTLTNVQNSLFVPDLGNWVNRRPTYVLSQSQQQMNPPRSRAGTDPTRGMSEAAPQPVQAPTEAPEPPAMSRTNTISSRLTDSHYAALPHGTTLEGWSAAEKWELDDHVRHMLHSRRSRFKRRLKGFGQYVRRPLGFFVTLYATLITAFGLAWVLFLIGWIYVGEKQVYAIHIIDSVLVALFAIMGDGLAPFRAIDTYHMIYVARYSRMIENAKKGKPPRTRLQKRNVPPEVRESMDLAVRTSSQQQTLPRMPDPRVDSRQFFESDQALEQFPDLEDVKSSSGSEEFDASYLNYAQQKSLAHHQEKLSKSHSFYKPHETYTHYAFPLKYLMAIVILLDCHSCLQISLGACTWGIDYHVRPFALTTVILCVSITCNITAGLVISIGDRKSRKKDVLKLLDRQELTGDAIKHMEEKKRKEQEENGELVEEEPLQDEQKEKELSKGKLTKQPSL